MGSTSNDVVGNMTARKQRKPAATPLQMAERLDFTESQLVKRVPEYRLKRILAKRYRVDERQGLRYIEQVRARWDLEARVNGDREARRTHMRKTLENLHEVALTPQKVSKTKVQPPDVRAAARTAKLLMELDALAEEPPKQTLQLEGTIGVAAATTSAPDRTALEAWLRGKAPNPTPPPEIE
jgi:hypothetical protein